MKTKHDEVQDRKIAQNAKSIRELVSYLREIRDHFLPQQEEKRFKLLRKAVVGPVLKIFACFVFICGIWDFMGWYIDRIEMKLMASRYAEIAEEMYYNENNPEVALSFLDKAIELQDGDPDYRFLNAYINGMAATRKLQNLDRPLSKGELDSAHEAYAQALYLQKLKPDRPEAYILQGQILASLKEYERAKEKIAKAIELDPKNAFARIRMAMLLIDGKKYAEAERTLALAEQLDPNSKWVWLWKGILVWERDRNPDLARKYYDKALQIDPKFDLAVYNRSWTWAAKGKADYAKGREELKEVLRINPAYKEACYAMGMFYGYEDNYDVAKVWLEKAISLDENYLTAYKWHGIVCGEMKQYEAAVESFNSAISLDPMNADLYVRRAKCHELSGNNNAALADLRFALEMQPKAKRTYLYLGRLYLKMTDAKKALEYLNKAIVLDPKYDDAYAARAKAFVAMGESDDAIASIDKAIEVCKYKKERFWMGKGEVYCAIGDTAKELACYVQARSVRPDFVEAWKAEANLLIKMKDNEKAVSALRKYLELMPTDSAARKKLEELSR